MPDIETVFILCIVFTVLDIVVTSLLALKVLIRYSKVVDHDKFS